MSKPLLIATFFASLASGVCAQNSGQGQSIMFENQPDDRDYLTTLPGNQKQQSRGDRCMEMLQEAERLKGKPQRRSAVMDRYRKECEMQ